MTSAGRSGRGLALMAVLLAASPASGADTVETFELGLSDLEIYTGGTGLGLPRGESAPFAEIVAGFGVTPSLSFGLSAYLPGRCRLRDGDPAFEAGGFGTPVNTDHLDLDLGLAVAHVGGTVAFSEWFELNLDRRPELAAAGLYLRGSLNGHTRGDLEPGAGRLGASALLGAYVTVARRHQLLLEIDGSWMPGVEPAASCRELGEGHLGYNLVVLDTLELIQDLGIDLPRGGDRVSYSLFLGIIATLP